jgi:hypothetical protein
MRLLLGLCGGLLLPSYAGAITFSASQTISGYTYAAQADFTYDSLNHQLIITLTNTAPVQAANQGQTLSGIYFDVAGNPVLTKHSAATAAGSSIVNDTPNLNDALIGREWAFRNNIGAAEASFTDARYGISSTGLGIFSPADRFLTDGNLAGPNSVGGDDFNIVPAVQSNFSGGGLNGTPFVRSAMSFILNTPHNFTFNIFNVAFHYGSGQDFPTLVAPNPPADPQVPEPGALAMLCGAACAALVVLRRRFR